MTELTLAPMEGVVDVYIRDILTRIGGFDLCVSEFVRVSQNLFPAHVFYHYCPELKEGGRTPAGVPVHVQIMGGETSVVAENAAFVAELGALGIDLNFGCPAKTVNRHDAGATLLQWPDRLFEIISAVRRAVPREIPVSAKMRLGFKDKSLALENALAVEAAGAGKLTVHARTKLEGYKPPAHWELLRPLKEVISIPLVANGEIWTREDYLACRAASGCDDVMIGRGAIARPSLAKEIGNLDPKAAEAAEYGWDDILDLLVTYYDMIMTSRNSSWQAGRMKQWIKLLARAYPQSMELFTRIRRMQTPEEIVNEIKSLRDAKVLAA